MRRRSLLVGMGSLLTSPLWLPGQGRSHASAADETRQQSGVIKPGLPQRLSRGRSTPFDYAWLKGQARTLATQPYRSPEEHFSPALRQSLLKMSWDQYQSIRFLPQHALWSHLKSNFRVSFFHLGLFYAKPVRVYEVVQGRAEELTYQPAWFDLSHSGLEASSLPANLGFAGLRLSFHDDWLRDVTAFLGASYFRAVSGTMQYGLSARGLAIDCGMERAEEFPDFTAFWLERPAPGATSLTVYALLDSPSVSGAYRFVITPGQACVMDVDVALYARKPIERLGLAPLTSMFMRSDFSRRVDNDWRPNIHDSDGLSMWTSSGEWLWRPLANPERLHFNAFEGNTPRGFGLLQRDRVFDHYQDDGVFYDRRPSLWVEPRGPEQAWHEGKIDLVELPAADETVDNVVAFWQPSQAIKPGLERLFAYRLHWASGVPVTTTLAHVAASRSGIGGVVGVPRKKFSWRFVIDFAGGPLSMLSANAAVEAVVSASAGRIELVSAWPLSSIQGYRTTFDLVPEHSSSTPIQLRLFLRLDGQALSETWMFQWAPGLL